LDTPLFIVLLTKLSRIKSIKRLKKENEMKATIEAMKQAAKGCGDCFLQDCDWPSCVPKVKEAIDHEEAQSVESDTFSDLRFIQRVLESPSTIEDKKYALEKVRAVRKSWHKAQRVEPVTFRKISVTGTKAELLARLGDGSGLSKDNTLKDIKSEIKLRNSWGYHHAPEQK